MSGSRPGILAVLAASSETPIREELVLDLVAVLDALVGGEFEIVFPHGRIDALDALRHRYPNLPLRAIDVDLAAAISSGDRELILLVAADSELDLFELNHFVE